MSTDSIIQKYLGSASAQYEQRARERIRAREKEEKRVLSVETRKQDLLSDPTKVDKYASGVGLALSPTLKKPKYSKYQTRTEAIEAKVPKDHPMAGFSTEYQTRFTQALSDPEYRGLDKKEIGEALAKQMYMNEPGIGGRTRYQAALEYKAQKDHSISRLFGLRGEDTSVKKPVGYDEYLQAVKNTSSESHISVGGAAIGGTIVAVGTRIAALGLARTSIPWVAAKAAAAIGATASAPAIAAGAVGLGIGILGWQAIKTALDASVYGKTHEEAKWTKPGTWDKVALELGGSFLLEGGISRAGIGVLKKAVKHNMLNDVLLTQFAKHPKAKAAIELGKAQQAGLKATRDLAKVKPVKEAVYTAVKSREDIIAEGTIKTAASTLQKYAPGVKPYKLQIQKPEVKPLLVGKTGLEVTQPGKGGTIIIDETGIVGTRPATKKEVNAFRKLYNKEAPEWSKLNINPKQAFKNFDEQEVALVLNRAQTLGIDIATFEHVYGTELVRKIWSLEKGLKSPSIPGHLKGVEVYPPTATYTAALTKPGKTGGKLLQGMETTMPAVGTHTKAWDILEQNMRGFRLDPLAENFIDDVVTAGGGVLDEMVTAAIAKGQGNDIIASILKQAGKTPKEAAKHLIASGIKTVKLDTEMVVGRTILQKALRGKVLNKAEEEVASNDKIMKQVVDELDDEVLDEFGKPFKYAEESERSELSGLNFGKIAIASAATVPLALVLADTSEAGGIMARVSKLFVPALKAAEKKGKKPLNNLVNELYDNTYFDMPVGGSKVLPTPMLSKPGSGSMSEVVTKNYGEMVKGIRRTKGLKLYADKLLSASGMGKLFWKAGGSPDPELGLRFVASQKNSTAAFEVLGNIMGAVPGVSGHSTKLVHEAMKPLAKKYQHEVVALSAAEFQIETLTTTTNKLIQTLQKGKLPKSKLKETKRGLEEANKKLADLVPKRNKLQEVNKEFNTVWEATVKSLAETNPATRIALAAEDTTNFTLYPWLKPMMNIEEKEAVGYLKTMMGSFKSRSKNAGLEVIENRPYMHHAFHKSWSEANMKKYLETLKIDVGIGTPMTKFYHRSKYSKMMMPDINYIMQRYIPDTEKRIQWREFWHGGGKDSWWNLAKHPVVQNSRPLNDYFNRLKVMTVPEATTKFNDWANRYASLEVFRLLGFSSSVAFKHAFKLPATWAKLGIGSAATHMPESAKIAVANISNSKSLAKRFKDLGVEGIKDTRELLKIGVKTYSQQSRALSYMVDMDLGGRYTGGFDNVLREMNKKAGFLVRGVESFDRAHSFLATLDMAAKRGLTAKDAMYGIMDTIVTTNFLSGPLNPIWMKDPLVRAIFLFQNTPFKILERRLAGLSSTVRIGKKVINFAKTDKSAFVQEVKELKRYIFNGQDKLKGGIITDALRSESDMLGGNQAKAFMQEFMIVGMLAAGGSSLLGWNLHPQLFHLPFFRDDTVAPTLTVSPIVKAFLETKADIFRTHEESEDTEFFMTEFMHNWLGKSKGLPITVNKMLRLSEDDIPERYQGSAFQYLFAIPSKGKH